MLVGVGLRAKFKNKIFTCWQMFQSIKYAGLAYRQQQILIKYVDMR